MPERETSINENTFAKEGIVIADDPSYHHEHPNDESQLSPVEKWIQSNPQIRQREIDYLMTEDLGFPISITDEGKLQQPFAVNNWIFLLVFDMTFPRRNDQGKVPARVYLVTPTMDDIIAQLRGKKPKSLCADASGEAYIDFGEDGITEYEQFLNGQSMNHMSGNLIYRTRVWALDVQKAIATSPSNQQHKGRFNIPFLMRRKNRDEVYDWNPSNRLSKYVDGRKRTAAQANPRCQKVVLSDRAFIQIFNESRARIETETGGLLLGHFDQGVWYVVEASDPGINAKFYNSYHEGDDVYENHVCGVISRTYKYPLVFLGMWHRHPGSLDTFSGTDDRTNFKYAGSAGNGCISAIINYDPDFRITFYYVEQDGSSRVLYTRVDVEVGNDKFLKPEMMQIASKEDVLDRLLR